MFLVLLKSFTFILIIFMGYGLKKAGFFKKEDYRLISKIVLNITLPASVIYAFADFERDFSLYFIVLIGFVCSFIPLLFTYFTTKKNHKETRVLKMLTTSGFNIGCFTLPLIQAFFGPAGIIPACMFDAGNAVMVTGGSYAMTSSLLHTDDTQKNTPITFIMKFLKSVPFDTYMIMLLISAFNLHLPSGIFEITSVIGSANSFLAMLMFGIIFEITLDRTYIKSIFIIILSRLLFASFFSILIYFCTPFSLITRQILAITVFAPASALAPVYMEKCHMDGSISSFTGSISILLSLIIMTVMALIMGV